MKQRSLYRPLGLAFLLMTTLTAMSDNPGSARTGGDRFAVTRVQVTASNYHGACSGDVTFTARIEAVGAGTVRYQWITDDGEGGMTGTLTFDGSNGARRVYMSIQGVVNEGRKNRTGWGAIRVIEPNAVESNRASYNAVCGD